MAYNLKNIGSHDSNANVLRSIGLKITDLELFSFDPVGNFSKIVIFKDLAVF